MTSFAALRMTAAASPHLRLIDHSPLDDDLDLDALSSIAAYSKYHFHRQFTATFRLSVHRQRFGQSPSSFRKSPDWEPWLEAIARNTVAFRRPFNERPDRTLRFWAPPSLDRLRDWPLSRRHFSIG